METRCCFYVLVVKKKRKQNGHGRGRHAPTPDMQTRRVHCIYIWCTIFARALIESSCPFFFLFCFSFSSPTHMHHLSSFFYIYIMCCNGGKSKHTQRVFILCRAGKTASRVSSWFYRTARTSALTTRPLPSSRRYRNCKKNTKNVIYCMHITNNGMAIPNTYVHF